MAHRELEPIKGLKLMPLTLLKLDSLNWVKPHAPNNVQNTTPPIRNLRECLIPPDDFFRRFLPLTPARGEGEIRRAHLMMCSSHKTGETTILSTRSNSSYI